MEVYRNEITQANPEQRQRGLRVLSLDGGGVRGLSSLHILQYLMKRIDSENPPKPCDYFDLIGGTSTGGLIAIMLGRLRMDIHECITAYKVISRRVFTPKRSKRNILGRGKDLWSLAGAFDSNALADEIARVVEACGLDRNAKLLEKEAHCKVFVCATRAEISTTVRLRNYRTAMTVDEVNCTIVEAARATSAASSFFAPIEIEGQKFVDGATGSNNPVDDVLDEVNTIWPGENSRLERFVSVGTGTPSLKAFGTNLKELASTLVAMAVDTERVAERFQKQDVRANGLSSNYFRFNVRRGLEDVGLEEHAKQGTIIAATNNYLDEYETREKVQEFVEASQRE
ncbi:FabD/lysophospholipase-like protein [Lojkania enalia]|uniref:FabD/lysophospholipase-like protein n=1 Tax=Lojkania enalia TaxID=147567 RepID=A0A9P4N517_9PLEO|nr:FabD/lysophospholipase-like protein [Didymosphaeria enalia]